MVYVYVKVLYYQLFSNPMTGPTDIPDVPGEIKQAGPDHVGVIDVTTEDVCVLMGRVRTLEEQLRAMQMGFNRLQAALQPALSQRGACADQTGVGPGS